ncbi:hypothetical protein [Aeromicrobium duanguangcaii]|nr:hypothetical protein [Aeromicrobium duanguangcaii]MCL3839057.1 hypothetical protein [Aeromicrobium duanguangcaii]
MRAEAEGIDADQFKQVAEEAKETCPVSKALDGVDDMTLDATLETV